MRLRRMGRMRNGTRTRMSGMRMRRVLLQKMRIGMYQNISNLRFLSETIHGLPFRNGNAGRNSQKESFG